MELFVPEVEEKEIILNRPEEKVLADNKDETGHEFDVSLDVPLRFQQLVLQDLVSEDGLVIMGLGLGVEPIVANLLHVLASPSASKRSLVILLNAGEEENVRIGESLQELMWLDSVEDAQRPFIVVGGGDSLTIDKRNQLYNKGGIISVTSRVFVVDLLSGVVDPQLITGIVLLHADRIKETSNESFILTLYRELNQWGFIKALSDEPDFFTKGFQPLYNKLKSLRLSKTFLWPRFHIDVTTSLQQSPNVPSLVTEINVKLSDSMEKIQIALLGCIELCIAELRRHNPELSTEYWVSSNALDQDFVRIIRATLDPVWHRVSWTTKQLIFDLSTLKELLVKLLTHDSISFYELVQQIYESNKPSVNVMKMNQSPWLMLDEATTIITYAKKRVFDKIGDGTYLLEEQPKWEQLAILLQDINDDKFHKDDQESGPILIMCSDSVVCKQLQTYITSMTSTVKSFGHKSFSGRKMMIDKIQDHLIWKDALITVTKDIQTQMLAAQQRTTMLQRQQEAESLNTSKTFTRGRAPPGKRRRTRGGSVVAAVGRLHSAELDKNDDIDDNIINKLQDDIKVEEDDDIEITKHTPSYHYIDRKDQVIIEKYNNKTDDSLLQELAPSYIIMYEPNLSFIRRVEIYQLINKDNPAKLFFMYYGGSVEEEIHLSNIKKEKEIFTKLIREKGQLANSYTTELDNFKFQTTKSQVYNTRIAGGSGFKDPNQVTQVIVDIREFSGSSLPNLLHRIGIKVIPCMLTVGDYIISPKICIERKLIPDLIQSFKSGRLYTQCEQMFRHYELPTLLIEFDANKSFSLEPFAEIHSRSKENTQNSDPVSSKLLQQDIQSKIMMLLIAFPKLKIIWSSSPYQTAQIILELKSKHEEPDLDTAISTGLDEIDDTIDGPPRYNDSMVDLIQKIPGINNVNYHLIISKVKNLQELVTMSEQELSLIIGTELAKKAYIFINRSVA